MAEKHRLGATGRFPDGKLNDDDEGELVVRIGVAEGNVMIDFGKPVKWIAMPPAYALNLARQLEKAAAAARKQA